LDGIKNTNIGCFSRPKLYIALKFIYTLMILIDIDKRKEMPLHSQVYSELKRMISESTLKVGDRLPPSRQLAESLGINRSTIMRAYEELWAEGYLESRSGSYSTVRQRKELVREHTEITGVSDNWQEKFNKQTSELKAKLSLRKPLIVDSDTISFLDLSPDNRLIPIDDFRKSMNHVLKYNGEEKACFLSGYFF
jgi:GntR family transcriptional regulator/MocR family aminotransferase